MDDETDLEQTKRTPIRILIVEDYEDICDFLEDAFERIGWHTDYVLTGNEALSLIKQNRWDIYLVNLDLPRGASGFDVIQAIRASQPDAKIVAMTGFISNGKLQSQAKEAGSDRYLEKPSGVQPEVIIKEFKSLLADKEDGRSTSKP